MRRRGGVSSSLDFVVRVTSGLDSGWESGPFLCALWFCLVPRVARCRLGVWLRAEGRFALPLGWVFFQAVRKLALRAQTVLTFP